MSPDRSNILDFESPILELEEKLSSLKQKGFSGDSKEMVKLRERLSELEASVYEDLSEWEEVQIARHPDRPTTIQYIKYICDDFKELHGDRLYGDDPAVVGGLASIGDRRIMLLGHEKGLNTRDRLKRNFGMASPEGFRKSLRLMRMAEKFKIPIVSFVDTPGAYPGVGAEERGQPVAIASNLREMFRIRTPILVIIIGEGGSGGALALAVGDRVLMMRHSVYSVISPEGCAAILWKNREKAPEAASTLRLTARDCLRLKVIDSIIEEPGGAAHRDPQGNARQIKEIILREMEVLEKKSKDRLLDERMKRFSEIGVFNGDS